MANPASSLQELYKTNVKLCYPFVEALLSTIKLQCGVSGRVGKPIFKSPELEDRVDIAISASISTSDSMASVMLTFTKPVFLKLMGKMFGEIYTDFTPELEDGGKELINIVFNQAKKPLAEKGFAAVRSIPQVIFGNNMKVSYLTRGQTIALPIDTDLGPISVEITAQEISVSDSV